MIGRKTTVGLSLLCALLFSAIAVQSASAAKAVNTTAVTCVENGGKKDFKDAHCDEKVVEGTGKFGHEAIANDTTTEIGVTNTLTGGATDPAVLKGKAFGAAAEITCNKVASEAKKSFIHNVESPEKKHTVTGTVVVNYTDCSVQKPAKCDVKEPIQVKAEFEGVEGLESADKTKKETMGVQFKAKGAEAFAKIEFVNLGAEKCSLDKKTVSVEGSAIGTGTPEPSKANKHAGATVNFDHTKITATKELIFGGEAAGFDNTATVYMEDAFKRPISLTTTT